MPSSCCNFRRTILLLALTLAVVPCAAHAAVKTVVPERFVPILATESAAINPLAITSGGALSAAFTAPVKLPVGAKVTKLQYYHWGNGVGSTSVILYRTKIGQPFNPITDGTLLRVTSAAVAPVSSPPQIVSTIFPANAESDLIVRPGYRYFLVASCSNNGNWINGVKVFYK